jgi:acyl carrier protein
MLSSDDIRRHICAVLSAIQTDSGLETPSLTDETKPLGDLLGFDSLATVDAEVRLSEALGVELDHVPFKSPVTGKEQTIGEIVAQLADKYGRATSASSPEKQP